MNELSTWYSKLRAPMSVKLSVKIADKKHRRTGPYTVITAEYEINRDIDEPKEWMLYNASEDWTYGNITYQDSTRACKLAGHDENVAIDKDVRFGLKLLFISAIRELLENNEVICYWEVLYDGKF